MRTWAIDWAAVEASIWWRAGAVALFLGLALAARRLGRYTRAEDYEPGDWGGPPPREAARD